MVTKTIRRHRSKRHLSWKSALTSVLIALISFVTYTITDAITDAFHSVRLPHSEYPAELYSNQAGDDLRKTFLTAIEQAKKSIVLVVYALNDPKIIKSLDKKTKEGVSVTVIYDEDATSSLADSFLDSKAEIIKRHGSGLMHLKLLVIDGKQTWIGSANMTPDSLRVHGNLVMALDSEPVAHLVTHKAKSLTPSDRTSLFHSQFFSIGDQTMELWFLPDNKEAVDRLLTLIFKAKKRIRVAMFTWTREDLADAIVAAKTRGVKVEVAMDHYAGKGANAKIVEKLCKAGVPVCFNKGNGLLHYKMMLIDDQILVNGSANWTKAAFNQNDDCFMVLYDLNKMQQEHLDKMWKTIWQEAELQSEPMAA